MAEGILDVDDVERPVVALSASDDTHTTQIPTSGNHDDIANIKLDKVRDFPCGDVDTYSIIDLYLGVRVSYGSPIVGHTVWNTLLPQGCTLHLAKLVLRV